MNEEIERLADLEHQQWIVWMTWMLSVSKNEDGSITVPAHLVERWTRQMNTPYAELSEKEKDSDREWAYKVLAVFDYGEDRTTED